MALNKEKVMESARKYAEKNQLDRAVKEYLRVVQEDPNDVRVWLKIGDLYAKKGAKQDAVETYLKVARFYQDQGFFLKAVAVYKQVLKLEPRLVDVNIKLAELYRQLGLLGEAMQHFEAVAGHYHREGNTKQALATVRQLVELEPDNVATRIKLAELYSKEGLVDDAVTEFTVAIEQLRKLGREEDFLKVSERLLWHKPGNVPLARELASLYLRRNDARRALQKLQACFKADPRDPETLGLLAQAFEALDQRAKTVSVLKELARILDENKQRDRAVEVHRKILQLLPGDAEALAYLGAGAAAAGGARPSSPNTPRASQPSPLAAAAASKFKITGEVPALQGNGRMTGSMPLVDPSTLDADFSAELQVDHRADSAAGEAHAEEIAKILTETDVYVKYGLHQKAIDHLRRIFAFDPRNLEAHERLKDVYLAQGREREALEELVQLAELSAPHDPDRAAMFVREALGIDARFTAALDVARRLRLNLDAGPRRSGGAVAPAPVAANELEFDFDSAPRAAAPRPTYDSVDDFDPDELIGPPSAQGSPAPGYVPGAQTATRRAPLPYQAPADDLADDLADDELDLEPPTGTDDLAYSTGAHARASYGAGGLDAQIDAQLEDADADLDRAVAAEFADLDPSVDEPFDHHAARAFDAGVTGPTPRASSQVPYVDEDAAAYGASAYVPAYETPAYQPPASYAAPDVETVAGMPAAGPSVEDELDEADFYIGQGMLDEALTALDALADRYPEHRMVLAKRRDVIGLMADRSAAADQIDAADIESEVAIETAVGDFDAEPLELDEIEELEPELELEAEAEVEAAATFSPQAASAARAKPSVMLERPVDEGDADTHYDLGQAYKEMGLFDEAIKAFGKVIGLPGREVQCRLMIGLCHREQGQFSDAVQQFKAALHAGTVSEHERQTLYYELGVAYEAQGDAREALYYLDMVVKRDALFLDASVRVQRLRNGGPRPSLDTTDPLGDDLLDEP